MTSAHRRFAPGDQGDRGAVAVIVALTVAFLLIPTAALAVDLGTVYVRTSGLQAAADAAAHAGATELARRQNFGDSSAQAMSAARTAAIEVLCADPALARYWQTPCSQRSWSSDGDPANGEVAFYSGAPSAADRVYTPDQAATGSALVSGVRVLTPPSHVSYGLAGAFGRGSTDLQKAATATLRTVLPRYGFLPLFAIKNQHGGFCIRSAPKSIWQYTHPEGVCEITGPMPRGYLKVSRTSSSETPTVVWNTARGIDFAHLPFSGQTVTLQPQQASRGESALVRDLTPGLFGSTTGFSATGRLTSPGCPGASIVSNGHAGVEGAHLADFADSRRGSADELRTAILAGSAATPAQAGWLRSSILRCGRLALLPELAEISNGGDMPSLPLPTTGLPGPSYRVTGWQLVWIDNEFRSGESSSQKIATAAGNCMQRGLYVEDQSYSGYCPSGWPLRAITGYRLDPGMLPPVVSGDDAATTIDYVGGDLPANVRLIRDVDDPPAG